MGVVSALAQEYSPGIGVALGDQAAHHLGLRGLEIGPALPWEFENLTPFRQAFSAL